MIDEWLRIRLDRLQRAALAAGVVGLLASAVGATFNPDQFFFSYLFGYLFWMGLTLGSLSLVMLHHLVGGRWGFVIRRILEAGLAMLPLMLILFLPVLFGLDSLYAWARPGEAARDEVLRHQSIYLNRPAFAARLLLYFFVWLGLAYLLHRWSRQQDDTPDPEPTRRLRRLSGPGLVASALATTFAYVDWVMVLERSWYSTIFPVSILMGQVMTTLAFAILLLAWLGRVQPLCDILTPTHWHHLGNLLMAFMLVWTYLAFSQLLIIWAGNLPQEVTWYLHRSQGGWAAIAVILALFHFAVPFSFLLRRAVKRKPASLTTLAAVLLLAHLVFDYWLVLPSLHPNNLSFHWLDCAAPVGIGGIWVAVYVSLLKRRRGMPRNDPRLELLPSHAR
jgi:hypothetical protein